MRSDQFQLTDTWSIGRDPRNWILRKKKSSRWRAVSYYRTLEELFLDLHVKLRATGPREDTLTAQVDAAYKHAVMCTETFSQFLQSEGKSWLKVGPGVQ